MVLSPWHALSPRAGALGGPTPERSRDAPWPGGQGLPRKRAGEDWEGSGLGGRSRVVRGGGLVIGRRRGTTVHFWTPGLPVGVVPAVQVVPISPERPCWRVSQVGTMGAGNHYCEVQARAAPPPLRHPFRGLRGRHPIGGGFVCSVFQIIACTTVATIVSD